MLGYLPAIIIQSIGVFIPILGIIVLMRKGQGKENTFLVMANFGALMMNWGYMQTLRSTDYQEVVSVYKFEYFGSVMFYLFFILFLKSFFFKTKKLKGFVCAFFLFFLVEATSLGAVLLDSPLAYETVTVQYRKDDGKFFTNGIGNNGEMSDRLEIFVNPDLENEEIEYQTDPGDNPSESLEEDTQKSTESTDDTTTLSSESGTKRGYVALSVTHGSILQIRYCVLAFILLMSLLGTCIVVIKRKVREERRKILYITGAEIVVFASLLLSLWGRGTFNVAPVLVSCSIMSIICGTASGNFFTIADRGRGWVLDHSDIIFLIVDKDYHFLDANDYAEKVFPVLAQLPIHSLLPTDLKELFFSDENEIDCEEHKYAKRMAPIETKGKVIGYSILLVDMTGHYELMDKLERETQKAIAANEAKSNFMSNMSHEIRTPMNAIVGMTEIMLRHDQNDFNSEYLNNIKNSGNALLAVVNDILDFSKIESGKLEIIPEEYEIMSVLNDLSMIFLNRIGDKPLELIYDIDPNLPVRLYGDSGRIRQVLLNIVNNGIKYSEEGHVRLCIDAETISNNEIRLCCAVEDTGIGIREEDLPKLFTTFAQVDTKKNRGKEGTGLGLSIAKQLVETMGGKFTVESEYGKGSIFRFSMIQKVIDATPAARVKRTEDIYVSGKMAYEGSRQILEKLCSYYSNIHFVDPESVLKQKLDRLDYVFVDRDSYCRITDSNEEMSALERYNPEIITIHNPMMDQCDHEATTLMNKPLYTLNFCLAINHEVLSFKQNQERLMSFTAPDASVLIVDDNEMNRKVAAGLLEPINMNIDMAMDGKQAVEKIQNNHYDLIFMDHMMPIMDGIEATAIIRGLEGEYYQNLPIIALSANALAEAKLQFTNVGMNDFLAKPIKTKDLFHIVKKYLPVELIIESEQYLEESAVESEDLPVIEGLDVAAGVENSGGLKLFLSLLGDFYKLIDRKATKIEKCLDDGMIRDYTIEVHALKNTARMIGALELSDKFYELEMAGNANDIDILTQQTAPTLELYRSYKPILECYAAEDIIQKEEISREELIETICKLKDAMDCFDLDGADEAMKKLDNSKIPEAQRAKIQDLSALVADVSMEDVIHLCEELLEEI